MFKTHVAFGILLGVVTYTVFAPTQPFLFMALVLLGSMLPDIDHPNSVIGKRVKIVSFLFEHRGFFHSLFALVLFGSIGVLAFPGTGAALGIALGYFSHLLIDSITKEGIMTFHPLMHWRIRGIVRTGHSLEYIVMLLILLGIGASLLK